MWLCLPISTALSIRMWPGWRRSTVTDSAEIMNWTASMMVSSDCPVLDERTTTTCCEAVAQAFALLLSAG